MAKPARSDVQPELFAEFCRSQDPDAYAAACRAAIESDPDDVASRLSLAQAIGHCGDYDAKLEMLRGLAARHPRARQVNVALGLELMSRGRFREGWPFYAHRNRVTAGDFARRGLLPEREWRGQALKGARVLVHREQGLGDTIQFARYLIALQRAGAVPLLDAQGPVRPLLAASPALGRVLAENERIAPNFWIRLLDLVPLLTPTLDDVRWPGAYVAPPAEAGVTAVLPGSGLRVGVAWAGNAGYFMDPFRSMPLAALAPLADLRGCRFFSLMPATAAPEIVAADAGGWLSDLSAVSHPFERLAVLVGRMDVVVTVCTSIAHLAGAMGKPTLLMLSAMGEWRWGRGGAATPWYPSMRLFRQRRLGEWGPVVRDVAGALAAL